MVSAATSIPLIEKPSAETSPEAAAAGAGPCRDRRCGFSHASYDAALTGILAVAGQRGGLFVLTGAAGTGKTQVLNDAAARLTQGGALVGQVVNSQVEADDLLRLVGFAFGLPAGHLAKDRLLLALRDRFVGAGAPHRPAVLLVDEAHHLCDAAIDGLHLLYQLAAVPGQVLLIVLAGDEALAARLQRPEYDHIAPSILTRCRLDPLSLAETHAYVVQALVDAGWKGDPEMGTEALQLLHARTLGIPRLINLAIARLIVHGRLGGVRSLTASDLAAVLEQLGTDHPALLGGGPDRDGADPSRPDRDDVDRWTLPEDRSSSAPEVRRGRLAVRISLLSRTGDEGPSHEREAVGRVVSADRPSPRTDRGGRLALPGLAVAILTVGLLVFAGLGREDEQAIPPAAQVPEPRARVPATVDTGRDLPPDSPVPAALPAKAVADSARDMVAAGQDAAAGLGELLAKADAALVRQRLMVPAGDNAHDYYQAVLARDPDNAEARAGLRRILFAYRELAAQSLRRGDARQARLLAARGLKIAPRDPELLAIQRRAAWPATARRAPPEPDLLERIDRWLRSGDTSRSHFLEGH